MAPIPSRSTAEEARAAVNFSQVDWGRFIEFTRNEARRIVQTQPGITWKAIRADEKYSVRDRVNRLLAAESICAVGDDLIWWRMAIAIPSMIRSIARDNPHLIAGETDRGPEPSSFYDPVRNEYRRDVDDGN